MRVTVRSPAVPTSITLYEEIAVGPAAQVAACAGGASKSAAQIANPTKTTSEAIDRVSYSTPVTLVECDGQRWLVAPYGVTNWVKNARAAGQVELSRGGHAEIVSLTELDPIESAPVLRDYVRAIRVVRPFFDAGPDSPLDAFAEEAARHPVFRLANTQPADGVATSRE
jgi:hypothetical protein